MRIIAVDWSGAKQSAGRKIWAADFCDDSPVEVLITGKSRESIRNYLVETIRETDEVIVGLDFAFSFPSWFVESNASSARGLWEVAAQRGEKWLNECEPPFWGGKGARRSDLAGKDHYRLTEKELAGKVPGITPKSVFQINGGGAVGTGSIRAMAMLHSLSYSFSIWPFDTGLPKIVEIWPRVLTGKVRKSDRVERKRSS